MHVISKLMRYSMHLYIVYLYCIFYFHSRGVLDEFLSFPFPLLLLYVLCVRYCKQASLIMEHISIHGGSGWWTGWHGTRSPPPKWQFKFIQYPLTIRAGNYKRTQWPHPFCPHFQNRNWMRNMTLHLKHLSINWTMEIYWPHTINDPIENAIKKL